MEVKEKILLALLNRLPGGHRLRSQGCQRHSDDSHATLYKPNSHFADAFLNACHKFVVQRNTFRWWDGGHDGAHPEIHTA